MSTAQAIFFWLLNNKQEALADVSEIIGYASLLVAGIAKLLDLLVKGFPKLKVADDKLHWAVNWLASLSKSKWLNAVALNPKTKAVVAPQTPRFIPPAVPPVLVVALLLAGLLGAPARAAAPVFSSGPTIPLMEIRPGNPHPVNLAAGAGYQLSMTFPGLQKDIGGKTWDLLGVNAMVFGSAVSNISGSFSALSVAAGFCTMSSLFCLGGGHDILAANGSSGGFFGLFAFSLNFGFTPAVGPEHATLSPPRGNTLYW